ncbi:MAG: AMP-binding protein [Bacteroidota bacterium]
MTLPDPVRFWADRQPDAPALVTTERAWTWADLDARVSGTVRRLAGASPRIGVCAPTQPALVVLILAALRAGGVIIPLSPRWPQPMIDRARERLELAAILTESDLGALTEPGDVSGAPRDLQLDAPFTLVHTSGSTGTPKAALHTVGNHVASARGLMERFPLGPGDRWLLDLPLYHVGGLGVVMRCALAGAAMVLPESGMSTHEAVRSLRPTHASLVSTQLIRLLREDLELASLKLVLLGGSAFPPNVLDDALARGLPIVMSYGMTEMTSTITSSTLPAERDALATSGTMLPEREVRLSASGEIEVRGPTLFAGYVDGDRLHRPVDAEGWFATGDRGEMDEAGRLIVHGRIGNGFVSGGENIQPEAIEAVLTALPEVASAVVVPVNDAEFGARPVAFVQSAGPLLQPDALATALRVRLPGFMIPVAFLPWEGPTGLKPDRRALARDASSREKR